MATAANLRAVARELRHRRPHEAKLAAAFMDAAGKLPALLAKVDDNTDIITLVDVLPIQRVFSSMEPVAFEAMSAAARATLASEARHFEKQRVITLVDLLANEWAQTQSAEMVVSISRTTRQAIRDVVARGIRENATMAEIARDLRGTIGLTPRDSKALTSKLRTMKKEGASARAIEKESKRLRELMLNRRATTIARTEMVTAIEQAKLQEWAIAIGNGEVPANVKRRWIAKDPCATCRALAALKPVPIGQPFVLATGQAFMSPSAHVRCKCSVVLVYR